MSGTGSRAATLLVALAAAPFFVAPRVAGAAASAPAASRQLLVALSPGGSLRGLPRGAHATVLSATLGDMLVTLPSPSRTAAVAARLRADAGVLAVQRNDAWHQSATGVECAPRPDSPVTSQAAAVHADTVSPPSATPAIAVLDTGVDPSAPELAGRVRAGANVVNGGSDTGDADGHGTAVAAVAAAAPGEVRGVSPTTPIIPIKILDAQGASSAAWVVAGIEAALVRGAQVINISATGPASATPGHDDQVVQRAIDTAFSRGVIVVAPSGNEGTASVDVPAAYPHVLSVAATGSDGQPASFSNRGASVDLAAPGEALTEPAPKRVCPAGYQLVSGTSFSAPAAAGAAALLAASRPALSAPQRLELLRRGPAAGSAVSWSAQLGFGPLDVAAVLATPAPAPLPAEVDDDVFWVSGPRAGAHPALIGGAARSGAVSGRVDATKNPADVYRVRLRRGARLTAAVTLGGAGQVTLSLWDPRAGPFDVGLGRRTHRLAAAGPGASPRLSRRVIRRAGTYYLAVQVRSTPAGGSPYRLSAAIR